MRDKINTVRTTGNVNRQTWDPETVPVLRGWPLQVYLWWAKASGHTGRDNFCHFCRVVLIWAPLRMLFRIVFWPLKKAIDSERADAAADAMVEFFDDHGAAITRPFAWFFGAHPKQATWLRPWLAMPAALLVLGLTTRDGRAILVGVLIMALTIVAFITACVGITKGVKAYQHRREQARIDAYLREMYLRLYGRKLRFNELNFERWCKENNARRATYADTVLASFWFIKGNNRMAMNLYTTTFDRIVHPSGHSPKQKPTWLVNIGLGLELFVAFMAAKKKRICPIIEVPAAE